MDFTKQWNRAIPSYHRSTVSLRQPGWGVSLTCQHKDITGTTVNTTATSWWQIIIFSASPATCIWLKNVKFNKWSAGKHKVKLAGVRIPENLIKGRSKIRVGENTNQSQYQKVRSTFNIKERPKTNTYKGRNKTGGRSHRKKTKIPTDYNKQKIQIQDLQTTRRNIGYRINRNKKSGIKNHEITTKQGRSKNHKKHKRRTRKEQLKGAD